MIIRKTFFCTVLMAVCCGCTEELENNQQPETVQLEATIFDNAASKTVASDEGDTYSITWTGTVSTTPFYFVMKTNDSFASTLKIVVSDFTVIAA